jgi:hemerythrin
MAKVLKFPAERQGEIEELGSHHEVLADLISELQTEIKQRHGGQAVGAIVDKLEDYSRVHFAVEESLMRMLRYPDYAEHKAEHQEFVDQMSVYRNTLSLGKQSITLELTRFLRNWLVTHISVRDKESVQFFLACGVEPRAIERFARSALRSSDF